MPTTDVSSSRRDDFYRRQGDRTRRLVSSLRYREVPVSVVAGRQVAESLAGQAMILTAANLFARWARKIDVHVPNHGHREGNGSASHRQTTLQDRIHAEVEQANPFCDLRFDPPRKNALVLQIGPETPPAVQPNYAVSVDGWDAVGWRPEETAVSWGATDPHFVPAAQLAACLGAGQIFKEALGSSDGKLFSNVRWRLWNHQVLPVDEAGQQEYPNPPAVRFQAGHLLQAGVGAVGSNVLYFLGQADVEANLTLIDYDWVEVENLDRTLLFGIDHTAFPDGEDPSGATKKVHAAQDALSDVDGLTITSFDGSWDEFVLQRLSEKHYDLWLALANEQEAWDSMAQNLPPLVLHGTTTHDWRVTLGRHIPLTEYCLRCRFKPSTTAQFVCSEGEMEVPSEDTADFEEVHASLPFLSAAAAALVVGEILKTKTTGYGDQPNYVESDWKGTLGTSLARHRSGESDCPVCGDPPVDAWGTRIRNSQYGFLSQEVSPSS